MIKFLEDLLQKKTKDKQSEILLARWNYDKKIIPVALQSISNLFPHYSLHDESHSVTIINNIVRIMGEEMFEKLSAIDIWLILEAAYIHDIGMVVSGDKLKETIGSENFIEFFKDIANDERHNLYGFTVPFQVANNRIEMKERSFNLEINDGFKFILAEYFRIQHADRSESIIANSGNEIGLLLPIGVIPQRINKILGRICSCHTKDFRSVLELPFSEVGVDTENAHPRFVACLLRIGDLLDLDNNRFSEVMLRTLTKVPIDTLYHKSKHLSIESLRIDRKCISIKAVCDNYEVANITQHWFNYLNSEINNQMHKWNSIVPNKDLGYLPTIGNLTVELVNYEYIDGKNKPQFKVDSENALALLQGAGLYDGAYQCFRELLQNSVDSTLIRIWIENKNNYKFDSPNCEDFEKLVANFPIYINIEDLGVESNLKKWKISIIDSGTGISSEDLKYLINTGGSSKNKKRKRIIDDMPNWMKPSGTFGIGFQSVFLLTDQVNIETKSILTEEFKIIELNSPNSIKNGDILIKKQLSDNINRHGVKIDFIYSTKVIPDGWSIKNTHKNAILAAHNFDPFSHESMDIEVGRIVDQILNFADKCPIPISLTYNGETLLFKSAITRFGFFDNETSLELDVKITEDDSNSSTITYYKNQIVECKNSFSFLDIEVNIHGDRASEVLSLNRNKVKDDYLAKLRPQVLISSFKYIIANFDKLFPSDRQKSLASMYLNFYHPNTGDKFDIGAFNQWENFEIYLEDETKITIKELLDKIDTVELVYNGNTNRIYGDIYRLTNSKLEILLIQTTTSFYFTDFFISKAQLKLSNFFVESNKENKQKRITLTSLNILEPMSENSFSEFMLGLKYANLSARVIIPCMSKYAKLRLKKDARPNYVFNYRFNYEIYFHYPKMLSPYLYVETEDNVPTVKKELNDKVIAWVYLNRFDENTTKEEIIQAYNIFCNDFKVDELNNHSKPIRLFQ